MFKRLSSTPILLALLVFLFFTVAAFFVFILRYDFFRADVSFYWNESTDWRTPFNEHPPLYALSIALLRGLTLDALPPLALMWAINLAAFCVCLACLVRFLAGWGVSPGLAAFGALLFGLWPLVGLTYSVIPLADIPAIALTMAGFSSLQKRRYSLAGLLFGLAIITHKGVWPVIGFTILAEMWSQRRCFRFRPLYLGLTLLPLAVLWVAGSFYHGSAGWLMERSMEVNTTVGSTFPLLDGVLGTFREGGGKGLLKGLIVLFFLALTAGALVDSLRARYPHYEFGASVALAVLVMFVFSSAGTIWGPVRFSRFLVIPIMFSLYDRFPNLFESRTNRLLATGLAGVLFLSQLAYAWYTAKVFYGS